MKPHGTKKLLHSKNTGVWISQSLQNKQRLLLITHPTKHSDQIDKELKKLDIEKINNSFNNLKMDCRSKQRILKR